MIKLQSYSNLCGYYRIENFMLIKRQFYSNIWFQDGLTTADALDFNWSESALLSGCGLFETLRVIDGKAPLAYSHWQRLMNSLRYFEWTCNLTENKFNYILHQLIKHNQLVDAGIRLSIIYQNEHMLILAQAFERVGYSQPLQLTISPVISCSSPLAHHKTLSYLAPLWVKQLAKKANYDDAIRLNDKGVITEASVANIFFRTGTKLLTPAIAAGVLPGIMRAQILKLGPKCGFEVKEVLLKPQDILEVEEIFLCNALQGALPVCQLADIEVRDFSLAKKLNQLVFTNKGNIE